MIDKNTVICIVGPTASGKTAIGVELAKDLNAEIVSADSMQIYKEISVRYCKTTNRRNARYKTPYD